MSWVQLVRSAASAETERVKAQLQAAIRSLVLTIVAAAVLLIGLIFALAGLYGSLAARLPDWQAGALIALGALALCGVLLWLARRPGRPTGVRPATPPPRSAAAGLEADLEASAELGAAASSAARDFVARHRPNVLQLALAAFVFGLIASRQPPRGSRKRNRDRPGPPSPSP